MFKHYDANGDGNMDYKEFANIFLEGGANKEADVTAQDPYLQEKARREAASAKARGDNPQALLALFKDKLKARGARGMVGLRRLFNMMDDDGSQTLSMPEFGKACKEFKIGVSEENVPILFGLFDKNGDGTLQYDEFIETVRKPLSDSRGRLVEQAFDLLSDGGALIEMDDIKKIYTANAKRHPDVIQGRRTEQTVNLEFLETIEAHHSIYAPGETSMDRKEWFEYYSDIGSAI